MVRGQGLWPAPGYFGGKLNEILGAVKVGFFPRAGGLDVSGFLVLHDSAQIDERFSRGKPLGLMRCKTIGEAKMRVGVRVEFNAAAAVEADGGLVRGEALDDTGIAVKDAKMDGVSGQDDPVAAVEGLAGNLDRGAGKKARGKAAGLREGI